MLLLSDKARGTDRVVINIKQMNIGAMFKKQLAYADPTESATSRYVHTSHIFWTAIEVRYVSSELVLVARNMSGVQPAQWHCESTSRDKSARAARAEEALSRRNFTTSPILEAIVVATAKTHAT
jgi:hypothetical protein